MLSHKHLLTTFLLGLGVSTAANAANVDESKTNPVLLVHGFETYHIAKTDCDIKFSNVIKELKNQGFTGPFVTVTYYKESTNCSVNLAEFDDTINVDSTWKEIGSALSRYVNTTYSTSGQAVDILGHSMGGLIIRSAIQGGSEYQAGFSQMLIDDAVTIATPHLGSSFANVCIHRQCKSLSPTNPDFTWLQSNALPEGLTEIDWSVQGSTFDILVNKDSALAMDTDESHKQLFNGLTHNAQLINQGSVSYAVKSLASKEQ